MHPCVLLTPDIREPFAVVRHIFLALFVDCEPDVLAREFAEILPCRDDVLNHGNGVAVVKRSDHHFYGAAELVRNHVATPGPVHVGTYCGPIDKYPSRLHRLR